MEKKVLRTYDLVKARAAQLIQELKDKQTAGSQSTLSAEDQDRLQRAQDEANRRLAAKQIQQS